MKYLSDYTEQAQTELFDELGAFFAFLISSSMRQKKKALTMCLWPWG